ncbi:MAG: hypothetical protein ACRD0Y_11710 [Terriglobales bacterium]
MRRRGTVRTGMNEADLAVNAKALLPLLNGLSVAIAVLDASGAVVVHNQVAAEVFGGFGLPLLHTHPALRQALSCRQPMEMFLTHPSRRTRSRVRLAPIASWLLIESVALSSEWQLEQQLQASQASREIDACAREELMCAYEVQLTSLEEANAKMEEQKNLIEQLFAANAELLCRHLVGKEEGEMSARARTLPGTAARTASGQPERSTQTMASRRGRLPERHL